MSIILREVDLDPTFTATGTLEVDQADGFRLTSPTGGVVRLDILPANETQAGIVSEIAQTFGGHKQFPDDIRVSHFIDFGPFDESVSSLHSFISSGNAPGEHATVSVVAAQNYADANTVLIHLDTSNQSVLFRASDFAGPLPLTLFIEDDTGIHTGITNTVAGLEFVSGWLVGGSFDAATGIPDGSIALSQLADIAGLSVVGRGVNSAGAPSPITAATDGHVLQSQGATLAWGYVDTVNLAPNAVTDSRIIDRVALSVMGRAVNSGGDVADIVAGADGDVLRRSGATLGFGALPAVALPLFSTLTDNSAPAEADAFPHYDDSAGSNKRVSLSALSKYLIPPGTVWPYAAASVPSGWLECDGSAVSRATYADLFATVSTIWGAGDGSTTFNLPDFRGRSLLGAGTGPGLSTRTVGGQGGAETHQLTASEMPAHTHTYFAMNAGPGSLGNVAGGAGVNTPTGSAGGDGSHNNMPPWAGVTWLIKT